MEQTGKRCFQQLLCWHGKEHNPLDVEYEAEGKVKRMCSKAQAGMQQQQAHRSRREQGRERIQSTPHLELVWWDGRLDVSCGQGQLQQHFWPKQNRNAPLVHVRAIGHQWSRRFLIVHVLPSSLGTGTECGQRGGLKDTLRVHDRDFWTKTDPSRDFQIQVQPQIEFFNFRNIYDFLKKLVMLITKIS